MFIKTQTETLLNADEIYCIFKNEFKKVNGNLYTIDAITNDCERQVLGTYSSEEAREIAYKDLLEDMHPIKITSDKEATARVKADHKKKSIKRDKATINFRAIQKEVEANAKEAEKNRNLDSIGTSIE